MQKLILTCDSCGQRMQVPRSAIGRNGMCPSCGASIRISASNTTAVSRQRPAPGGGGGGLFSARNLFWRGRGAGESPTEEAKQRFGRAVDLFYGGKHAEALAVFDSLAREYAGNQDIEAARQQCLAALRQGRGLALEHQPGEGWDAGGRGAGDRLDEETLIRVVTEKLLRGRSDEAQLHAAEIACKLLGIDGSKRVVPEPEPEPEPDDAPAEEQNTVDAAESGQDMAGDNGLETDTIIEMGVDEPAADGEAVEKD